MRRLTVVVAVLALGVAAPAASAVTPKEARSIAERVIAAGPEAGPFDPSGELIASQRRRRLKPVVEIHRLRRALKRGAKVGQGVERARRARRVRRRAFLFWGDYAPGAAFVHPSRIVLIDAATGDVAMNRVIAWWPEVNGKQVFARSRGRVRTPRVGPVRAQGAALVAGFRNDCLVTIGDRVDPHFLKGIAAMTRMANRTGMPSAGAKRPDDLGPTIDRLARSNPPCRDVMIYIGAHGFASKGSNIKLPSGVTVGETDKAQVTVRSRNNRGEIVEDQLGLDDVKRVIRARPHLTFKLVVESCFSGRWTPLMAEPNLRITLTSSGAGEVTFLAVTDPRRGQQSGGTLHLGGAEVGEPDGPDDPPPFTKGVTQAVDEWSEDTGNQNKELGAALSHAGDNRQGDRARALGWQHGRTDDRTGERPPGPGCALSPQPPCQPPGQVAYEVGVTGSYRHIGPGDSEVCWDVRTIPPRPNAEVTVDTSGPGLVSGSLQTVRTDSNGFVRVRVKINETGTYNSTTQVVAGDGAARSANASVEVTLADGTCPPP